MAELTISWRRSKTPFTVLFDEEDWEIVSSYRWQQKRTRGLCYVVAWVDQRWIRLHRLIMRAEEGQIVDHANGNGLDNRRANLRFCTHAQNVHNSKKRQGIVGLKGVSYYPNKYPAKPFVAQIMCDRQPRFLGCFPTANEAHAAYRAAALELHGEFARFE